MRSIINKLKNPAFLIFCTGLLTACSLQISDEQKNVTLAQRKDDKVYLFSDTGSFIAENSLKENEIPPVMKTTKVVQKEGTLYVDPSSLQDIVDLVSGNYVLFDAPEGSNVGFVTAGDEDVFVKKYTSKTGDKIGEIVSLADIFISDIDKTKEFHISWQRNPDQKAIENCVEMSLWTDRSYKPGETTLVKEDYIMMDLNKIIEFYDSDTKLEYSTKDKILYVVVK